MIENYNCSEENIEVYRDVWDTSALVIDANLGKIGFIINHKRTFKIADGSSILSAYMQWERKDYINIKIVTEEFGTMHFHTYDNPKWIGGSQHEYDVAYAKSGKLESLLSNLQYYYDYADDSFSSSTSSMTDELRELTDMYNSGSLSEDEFTKAKARLLG
ncbi:SHOCT domain-containing protein [Priestia megaterium]|uniref:SHOCT domain-containing protein n=1 Tax=Priestia megaterium TaxID=1404 RepID=UPI0036D8AA7A